MANQKLTQEELEQIEGIQKRMQAVKTELGQLGLAELDLKNRRTNIESYLSATQEIESQLVKDLEDKYGKGSIDLQNGEFIPSKQNNEKEVVPTVE
jgi:hypothetical protein